MISKENLQHTLERLKKQEKLMKEKTEDKENEFTFGGGWALGYVQGKIVAIEDLLDFIDS